VKYSLFALLAVAACDTPAEPAPVAEALVTTSSSWVRKADYPTTTYGAVSASYTNPATKQSTVYVIGGNSRGVISAGSVSDAVKAYDVARNSWTAKARLPMRLQEAAAVELNGKIYVAGGITRRWDARRSVWRRLAVKSLFVYDVATNRWSRKADLPTTTLAPVAVVSNGAIYLASACIDTPYCGQAQLSLGVWKYDVAADTWSLESRAEPVTYPTYVTGGAINGKLYLVGVHDGYNAVYDLTARTWSLGPGRQGWHCAPGGSITLQTVLYQIGCVSDVNEHAVMAFDPVAGSWTPLPPAPLEAGTLSRVTVNGIRRLEVVDGKQNWQGLP
jgi:hypothetical protein